VELTLLHSRAEAAEFLVSLTTASQKKALVSAAVARKAVAEIAEKYEAQIGPLWDKANKEALQHLTLVMQNNPHKPVSEILKRPDVESALRWPYEQAAKASEDLIRKAWDVSEKDALAKAKGEMKLLGADWKGHETDTSLLDDLVGDLHANASAMRSRYRKALTGDGDKEKGLQGITRDAKTRAKYSMTVAIWSVFSQVRDSAAQKAGVNRMWLSRLDADTCTHCLNLHGVVVGPGEPFPVEGLKTYKNKPLFGPPRHPNCRCVAVFTYAKKTVLKKLKAKTQKT